MGEVPPYNHQITNQKGLKTPYLHQKMVQITITNGPLRSPITKQTSSNYHIFFKVYQEIDSLSNPLNIWLTDALHSEQLSSS